MQANRTIVTRVKAAVKAGIPVTVDGWLVRDARIFEGEIEFDWAGTPESLWTAVQPNFMATVDGKLVIETD